MAAEQATLLPFDYFHVVFTLPRALNALIRVNPRALYALLFRTATATPISVAVSNASIASRYSPRSTRYSP